MALLVLLVNLPVLVLLVDSVRLAASGREVSAEVVETGRSESEDSYLVAFRLGEDDFPDLADDERVWPVAVDAEAWQRAQDQERVDVRVLPSRPEVHRVEGEVRSWAGVLGALAMNVVLAGVGVLWWRTRVVTEEPADHAQG